MSQTGILVTQEPAPQSVQVYDLPHKTCKIEHNTRPCNSSGLATVGFRSAKYLQEEWHRNNNACYQEACADCDFSQRNRHECKNLACETEALCQRTQEDSNRKTGERLQDIKFWKSELQREIEDLVAETDLLIDQKLRLERALDATEIPFSIARDNLQCRERRHPPDLVRDAVATELLKEAELIQNIQGILKRTLMQAINQIRLNREYKKICEMDWSDKVETYNIDETCAGYNNQSGSIHFHLHTTKCERRSKFLKKLKELQEEIESKTTLGEKPLRLSTASQSHVAASSPGLQSQATARRPAREGAAAAAQRVQAGKAQRPVREGVVDAGLEGA
ncbi:tektin-4-like [Petaurus breviceps papuanus]|uniref:tektin-4-like n=1 Tax=Petaurus breviceps papuanus TaxID=3040969 RepID=UPI0036DB3385